MARRSKPSLLSAYVPLIAIASLTALVVVLRNTGDGSSSP